MDSGGCIFPGHRRQGVGRCRRVLDDTGEQRAFPQDTEEGKA